MKVCPACDVRFVSAEWTCPSCGWQARRAGRIHCVGRAGAVEGFAADAFERLAAVEDRHFWFSARNALIVWALSRYFPGTRTFLDAGCGNGQVSRALQRSFSGLRVTACEPFLEGLTIAARGLPSAELVQADIRNLPWREEFDVTGAFDVLEHIPDDTEALRQLVRATRPGGGVMLTVPQHRWLWSPIDDYSRHVRRYSRALLTSRLEQAGLRVLRITSFVSLLLPVLLMSRMSRRRAPVDPMAEFRVSGPGNAAGGAAMSVERWLIRAGVPLPLGGSLLAISRRSDA